MALVADARDWSGAQERVAQLLERDSASRRYGVEVVSAAGGEVVLRMPVDDSMCNSHGILHGGFAYFLGDTCFAYVCAAEGVSAVTRQADITYLAPGVGAGWILARGRQKLRYGRNNIVDIDIYDDRETHLAHQRAFGVIRRDGQ